MYLNIKNKLIDCKTVGVFLKMSKEIGKVWRFSLVPDLLFDSSRVLELRKKYGLFCSLIVYQ